MPWEPAFGSVYRGADPYRPTVLCRLANANFLDLLLSRYRRTFKGSVLAAQRTLMQDLRSSGTDMPDSDTTHLVKVCGVRCRSERTCIHGGHPDRSGRPQALLAAADTEVDSGPQNRVAVGISHSLEKDQEALLECFPRGEDDIVVRIHLFYPHELACCSKEDVRGRLVGQRLHVPASAKDTQEHPLLHRRKGYRDKKETLEAEAMYPYSSNREAQPGFTAEQESLAITVETVFVRDATRGRAPHYREDAAQTRTYLSYLRASELVTDDELAAHLALVPPDARAMPAFADDRAAERLNVLVRLYLLAHDQGWTASLSAGSPHPLGRPQLPVLYRAPATEVDVADRRDPQAPALLRQALQPDAESQITRFCFRRVVSEALRRRVVARGAEAEEAEAAHYDAVVCYMPHGDRVPALTDAQVAVLAALHPALGIRRPATRAEWGRLSQTLYQHGVALLDVLRAVGTPLVDASGAEIAADAYVPYTPDMAQDFFLVVVNRPLRDYTCVVNQRWLLDDLLRRTCDTATTRDGFRAWVRYWNTVAQLKHELETRLCADVLSVHLGERLPADAYKDDAVCLVNGRVTDTGGGVVFSDLGGWTLSDTARVGHLPPGTAVVYRCWREKKLRFEYIAEPERWVGEQALAP